MTHERAEARSAFIIDDDVSVLEMLDDMLSDAGFATQRFVRGEPARAALEQQRADLLVVDVGLPDINGMALCEHARQLYGDDIIIFIITGDNQRSRCITALELGADEFIPKPFDTNELLARIDVKLQRLSKTHTH